MFYVVKGMTLIPQALRMSCWYASTRMLINWRQNKSKMSHEGLIPPELDAQCRNLRANNRGINNAGIIAMAQRLGLRMIPPMTPTVELLYQWLTQYGPLWVNGRTHIVVIAGLRWLPILGWQVQVYDPSPLNVGRIDWRSWEKWYTSGTSVSTRDTSASVQTVFLHCPEF